MAAKKKSRVPQKTMTHVVQTGNTCGKSCRVWSIIGGVISVLLGIVLFAELLSLESVVAIILVLGGLSCIFGCGMSKRM